MEQTKNKEVVEEKEARQLWYVDVTHATPEFSKVLEIFKTIGGKDNSTKMQVLTLGIKAFTQTAEFQNKLRIVRELVK